MAAEPAWRIEPIEKRHKRDEFDCGNAELTEHLRKYARQNEEFAIARTFVAVREGEERVWGYFTLRAGEVPLDALPEGVRRRFPRYPVPVVHLGRLAVDKAVRGQRLGEQLLVAALEKALAVSKEIGALAVEVIAIDEDAKAFYRHYGFDPLAGDPRHLYLPMKRIVQLF